MFIPVLFNGVLEDHYWSYSLIPVYEDGRIGGVYDAFRNMTATVVGAQRLRESEARLKLATEVANLGVFVWDNFEDRVSWENDRMYEIFHPAKTAPSTIRNFCATSCIPTTANLFGRLSSGPCKTASLSILKGQSISRTRPFAASKSREISNPIRNTSKGRILGYDPRYH